MIDRLGTADPNRCRWPGESDGGGVSREQAVATALEPFLSVGANQNIERDIDLSFCRERGITVVRRWLGGSAIYIDPEQLIFHVIVPAKRARRPAPRMLAVAEAVVDTYRDVGIAARLRRPGISPSTVARSAAPGTDRRQCNGRRTFHSASMP